MLDCVDLHVPLSVMQHVVNVESSGNPFAIGVVGGRLARQPKNLEEAIATVENLEKLGFNYSLGIAQVNKYNLKKYGLDSYAKAFDTCSNLKAGTKILNECYFSAKKDWGKAFSCYYSGNFVTGFRHGYVQKVLASMFRGGQYQSAQSLQETSKAIPVYGNKKTSVSSPTKVTQKVQNTRIQTRIIDRPVVVEQKENNKVAPARQEDGAFVF